MDEVLNLAKEAKEASRILSKLSTGVKNKVLQRIAEEIQGEKAFLKGENEKDLKEAKEKGLSKAMIDRLLLTEEVIEGMIKGLHEVASLPDPVGEITKMWRRPNNLLVGRMRIPLGVIGIIYESRPNVTVDAASLCLKSGNAVILRGGSEAIHSNLALKEVMQKVCREEGVPKGAIGMAKTTQREAVYEMLKLSDYIDVVIPRGGEELIRGVVEHSKIPVIKHYKGVCHIFVDASADLKMAEEVSLNAKVQRPGVCNAMETLLVHQDITQVFLPSMIKRFQEKGVEIRGCPKTLERFPYIKKAEEEDWSTEYLDLILSIKVVKDLDEAISHIERYGSNHTDTIITRDYQNSQRFLQEVNSSVVLVNASTRFNDGNQLGLGAEIGISTTKLHAFGPMGLEELTTTKFIVYGEGQLRKS